MARPGIRQVRCDSRHLLSTASRKSGGAFQFETMREAGDERDLRIRLLRAGPHINRRQKRAAAKLADRLETARDRGEHSDSLADPVFMRALRNHALGDLSRLVAESSPPVSTLTLIPLGWALRPEELSKTSPGRLLKAVLADLNRCGAKDADGWLIGIIHGEYDPVRGCFQLHVHGICAGGMIDVVRRLRTRPKYRSTRRDNRTVQSEPYQRVRVSRKPLTNIAAAVSYICQSFWPERSTLQLADGTVTRERIKKRIKNPFHSQYLLWLDQWSADEIKIVRKLTIRHGQFCVA